MREKLYIASISEDAASLAKEYGVGVELDQYCMAENMEPPKFKEIDRQVRRESGADTKFIFHAPFNELSPAAIDPKIRQIAYERYEQAYKLAHEHYNADKMVVHSGYIPLVYYKVWHHERSLEFWRSYMEGKDESLPLCIENVLEDEPYMMVRLVDELDCPNVGLCLDTGHANCVSEIPVSEWIRSMGNRIRHLHIHNNNGEHDEHRALPDGTINFGEILELTDQYCGPDLTITIESRDGRASLEWLDKEGFLK